MKMISVVNGENDEESEKGIIVMDTPERTQIANPLSKFEDSPVFNYINSLSPIKPVKSMHFTQTFSSLSFASLPSVFTSPHVSSIRDSKFLRRHQFSDPSKPEHIIEDAKKAETNEGNLGNDQNPSKQQTDFNPSDSNTSAMVSKEFERRNLKGFEATQHGKEVTGCDWDSMISDASELLNFNSPSEMVPYKGSGQNTLDCTDYKVDGTDNNPSEQNDGMKDEPENHLTVDSTLNNFEVAEPVEDADEGGPNMFRGMRRRCLVFEMSGTRRKHLEDSSNGSSLNTSESNQTVLPNDNNLPPLGATANDSSRCILPGIGLHLNSIASNLVDQKVIKHESSGSTRQLIIGHPSGIYGSMALATLDATSLENNMGPPQNSLSVAEDAKALNFVISEELSQGQTSPKKKRQVTCILIVFTLKVAPKKLITNGRRSDAGDGEACKRCNFTVNLLLRCLFVDPSSCRRLLQQAKHEDTSACNLARRLNPATLLHLLLKSLKPLIQCKRPSKMDRVALDALSTADAKVVRTHLVARMFAFIGSEMDLEVNHADESEGIGSDGSLQMVLHTEAEPISATPATPSRFGRQSIPFVNSSKGKPPRAFLAIGGSSSSQRFGKLNPFKGGENKQLQTVGENEIPEILEGNNGSPISGVKSCSPNSKNEESVTSTLGAAWDKEQQKLI
ncbi:tesmin/TSO1-like CXC 2 isoform X2 [Tanacetum coccineum]